MIQAEVSVDYTSLSMGGMEYVIEYLNNNDNLHITSWGEEGKLSDTCVDVWYVYGVKPYIPTIVIGTMNGMVVMGLAKKGKKYYVCCMTSRNDVMEAYSVNKDVATKITGEIKTWETDRYIVPMYTHELLSVLNGGKPPAQIQHQPTRQLILL